ncbi:MAG: flagellar basal body P-ring formation chaperone FlgA [Burkholderiaceae bacterium]|nr:flagellar basal body P-ring formation chaperone FlgA [Burkholderiaceae bacterium]
MLLFSALKRSAIAHAIGVCALVFANLPLAHAQDAGLEALRQEAQRWATDAVLKFQPPGANLRMQAEVGALDSRLRLAPCGNIEPHLPAGARLWGRSRVGLRCVDGVTRWNISLPVVVKATGKAWVMRGHVAAGATITESDVMEAEVDWAEEASPVLVDRTLWVGQTATRLLSTGQTLRQGMVKPTQVFQAGASVRVLAQGAGFQVSSQAQALSAGVVGQLARVRMENGRVASGLVLDVRTVKIEL